MEASTLVTEEVVAVTASATPSRFDPLVELQGLWTTAVAERYLPIEGLPPVKYECLDGNLIMSPREGSANSWATSRLTVVLDAPALNAGFFPYSSVNMRFEAQRWIEPDLAVLRQQVKQVTWVPAELVLMPIEFVSRSSVRNDRIDKPALCAAAGVPFFLTVEITSHEAHVELLRLDDSGKYVVQAKALAGQEFRTELPFPLSFDPAVLLES
jgi:Uma2 family endonuclease